MSEETKKQVTQPADGINIFGIHVSWWIIIAVIIGLIIYYNWEPVTHVKLNIPELNTMSIETQSIGIGDILKGEE